MTNRMGFALLFTLSAILIISALVAATMYRVGENTQLARLNTLRLHSAQSAESALHATLVDPSLAAFSGDPVGTVKLSTYPSPDAETTVRVTKVSSEMLWVTASATASRGPAHATRHVGASVQLKMSGSARLAEPLPGPNWVDLY